MNNKDFRKGYSSYMKNIKPSSELIQKTIELAYMEQERIQKPKEQKNFGFMYNLNFMKYSQLAFTMLLAVFAVKLWNGISLNEIPELDVTTTTSISETTEFTVSDTTDNIVTSLYDEDNIIVDTLTYTYTNTNNDQEYTTTVPTNDTADNNNQTTGFNNNIFSSSVDGTYNKITISNAPSLENFDSKNHATETSKTTTSTLDTNIDISPTDESIILNDTILQTTEYDGASGVLVTTATTIDLTIYDSEPLFIDGEGDCNDSSDYVTVNNANSVIITTSISTEDVTITSYGGNSNSSTSSLINYIAIRTTLIDGIFYKDNVIHMDIIKNYLLYSDTLVYVIPLGVTSSGNCDCIMIFNYDSIVNDYCMDYSNVVSDLNNSIYSMIEIVDIPNKSNKDSYMDIITFQEYNGIVLDLNFNGIGISEDKEDRSIFLDYISIDDATMN